MPRYSDKNVTPVSEAVSRRFFLALDRAVSLGLVRSQEAFLTSAGLCAPRYRNMRQTYGPSGDPSRPSRYKNLQVEALVALVSLLGVSARWLLCGLGPMFEHVPASPSNNNNHNHNHNPQNQTIPL